VLLDMRQLSKTFGATRALDGVSMTVDAGEVRALIGENGAGKSTLMKILSGAYRPDSGSMSLGGLPYAPRGPREALARGVAMIYQELALAPHLTVEANILLGQERVWAGLIRRREHRRIVQEALDLLEHPDIRPDTKVRVASRGRGRIEGSRASRGRAHRGVARIEGSRASRGRVLTLNFGPNVIRRGKKRNSVTWHGGSLKVQSQDLTPPLLFS
jgi:ABC-type hemin transport system ATPase subunit